MFLSFAQQLTLVDQGLAKRSDNGDLTTFKYAKKVMYDYLWHEHPELKECRGHTYSNETGELVIAAPRKTFNYLENGTWIGKSLSTPVKAFKKYNGYMACARYFNGELVVSTTGSTRSDYAIQAKEEILKVIKNPSLHFVDTLLFEIIVENDPHIVKEQFIGAVYLGCRLNHSGYFLPAHDTLVSSVRTLSDALELTKSEKGEGFMLYDNNGDCCKLKTDYYVGKKKLMRMSNKNVKAMYTDGKSFADVLPDSWRVHPYIINCNFFCEAWSNMDAQERRAFLETLE